MKKKMIKLLLNILILICIPMFSSCIAESIDSTAETVDMTDLDTSIQGGGTEDDTSSDSGNTDKGNLGDTDIYCTFYRYNDAYHNISNTLSQLVSGGKEDIENFKSTKKGASQKKTVEKGDAVTYEPLTQIRKAISKNMINSKHSAAHMSVFEEVEAEEV